MDDYLEAMVDDMQKALDAMKRDLSKVRTGRASPKLVEGLQVHVASYGATMPLNQLATINAPDARLLVVSPWDKSTLADVEKAIIQANLGLNPASDGQIIRLPVPPLTSERRRELVKMVRRIGEETKVRVRHVRREYNDLFRAAIKDGDVAEDEGHKLLDKVQQATDDYVAKVEQAVTDKEAEVQEV